MGILRAVTEPDLPIFFAHQQDATAARMAGVSPREREAFFAHWRDNVLQPGHVNRSIVVDGAVVGYVGSWEQNGERLVAYWIDRARWGQGVATRALTEFLALDPVRPLHASVVAHNAGSLRVLEKCGFRKTSEEPPSSPGGEAEVFFTLDAT